VLWASPALSGVFGSPPRATFDGQSQVAQALVQLPSGGIDRRCILEWRCGLFQDAGKHLRLLLEEVSDRLGALLDVARLAGQGKITGPIRSTSGTAEDMVDLERDIPGTAISALPAPFFQEILTQFVSCQRPLLVLDSCDGSIDQALSVKPHQLL